jgi:hypothetical protein
MIGPEEFQNIRPGHTRIKWKGHPGTIVGLPADARKLHDASLTAVGLQPDGAECSEGLVVAFDNDPATPMHMRGPELDVVEW